MSRLSNPRESYSPEYRFVEPGTQLFMNGVPLSGKTTIAPSVVAAIEGATLLNMDIMRLVAQEFDSKKPEALREPALQYDSCDGYLAVGDGLYSPESFLEGYRRYARGIMDVAHLVIPNLDVQGAQSVLFEGVQLQPSLVAPYLTGKNKLVVISSNKKQLEINRDKRYKGDPVMYGRYAIDRLLLMQEEILRQSTELPEESVIHFENAGNWRDVALQILGALRRANVIEYQDW